MLEDVRPGPCSRGARQFDRLHTDAEVVDVDDRLLGEVGTSLLTTVHR